jgi:hypothetical protein
MLQFAYMEEAGKEENMVRDRFEFVCQEAQSGNDAFVRHPSSREEGRVLTCLKEHLLVKTGEGNRRCWDYHECDKMSRSAEQFPYR